MMDEEKWISKLKSRLHDCEETPPANGWERLAGALPQAAPPVRRSLIPLWRSWQVTTAAAAIVLAFAVSLWLLNTDLPTGMQPPYQPAVAQTPSPIPAQPDEHPSTLPADSGSIQPAAPVIPAAPAAMRHEVAEVAMVTEVPAPAENTPAQSVEAKAEPEPAADRQPAEAPKERHITRPSSKDKLHLPADGGHRRSSKGWGMTLAVGNAGGLLANSQTISDHVQSSASENGITILQDQSIQIPADQEVCFMNGLPYLRKRAKRVASIDHKQPISFGISVRKNLTDRFSVETGLTYTYLASDVLFEGASQEVEQKLHYLGIPLRANWTFLQSGNFSLYLSGGGAIEKCVYGKTGDETTIVNPVQLSVAGSVGAQYKLGRHVGIYFEPGVSYYFDDRSDIQTLRKEKPCTFTMQGGVRLTY